MSELEVADEATSVQSDSAEHPRERPRNWNGSLRIAHQP